MLDCRKSSIIEVNGFVRCVDADVVVGEGECGGGSSNGRDINGVDHIADYGGVEVVG